MVELALAVLGKMLLPLPLALLKTLPSEDMLLKVSVTGVMPVQTPIEVRVSPGIGRPWLTSKDE